MVFGEISGRIGGIVVTVIALILLLIALRIGMQTQAFVQRALRADGTVTELNAGGSHPQIRFIAADKTEVSYPQGGFIFGFKQGDKVIVLYAPADPAGTATVDTLGAVWFTPLLLTGLGALFLAIGLVQWLGVPAIAKKSGV